MDSWYTYKNGALGYELKLVEKTKNKNSERDLLIHFKQNFHLIYGRIYRSFIGSKKMPITL